MNWSNIENKVKRAENNFINKEKLLRASKKELKVVGQNEQYRNKFTGRRCFILGNGPSLNQLDFKRLGDELVITVNELFRHKDFIDLKSDFHFFADPAYFSLKENIAGDKEIIDDLHRIADAGTSTKFFIPIDGRHSVRFYGWDKKLEFGYFLSQLHFYDDYQEDFDFAGFVPMFQAVVHWAIAFAAYLGCSEIYLLGCDATNIVTDLSLFTTDKVDLTYAYELSDVSAENVRRKHRQRGLEPTLWGYYRIVHIFGELNKYCRNQGIQLYNCSGESILDCIPKKSIELILERGL